MENTNNIYPVVVIIPSLNPDQQLIHTIDSILKEGFSDIILVDDGSNETCKEIFKKLSNFSEVKVITHDENKGKGAALKTAFSYYIEHYDCTYYKGGVTADADGQHLAKDIRKTSDRLLQELKEKDKRMVLGTRNFNDPIVPFKSKKGNKITTIVFKVLYGKIINDTQTGLRGISNAYINDCLSLSGERFEYEIDMLIDAVTSKVEIIEETIETVYLNDNRETHFHPIKDSIKIYKVLLKNFFSFSCVGLMSMILDQGLFALLLNVVFGFWNIEKAIIISTALARVCSSLFNYMMNRKVVFKSNIGIRSLFRYYILCVLQMFASAFCVAFVYMITKGNSTIIKLGVDLVLFFISYQIQQRWVFTKRGREDC